MRGSVKEALNLHHIYKSHIKNLIPLSKTYGEIKVIIIHSSFIILSKNDVIMIDSH